MAVTRADSAQVLATFVIAFVVPVLFLVVPVVVPVVVRHLVVPIGAVGIAVVDLVYPDLSAVIAVEPVDRVAVLVVLLLVGSVLAVIHHIVDPLEGYLRAITAEEGHPVVSVVRLEGPLEGPGVHELHVGSLAVAVRIDRVEAVAYAVNEGARVS